MTIHTQNVIEVPGLLGDINEDITKPQQHLYGDTINGKKLSEQGGDVKENFNLDNEKTLNKQDNIENDQESEGNLSESILESQLNDSKYMPILTGMLDSGNIDFDSYNKTIDKIKKLGENGKDEVPKIISNIIDKSGLDEKTKTLLKKQLEGQNQVNEEGFEKTKFAKHKNLLGLDKGIGGLELMLAENYIEIPNNKGEVRIEQNLATTMDITLNKILETKTPEFKQNNAVEIGKIRASSSLEDRYKNLQKIYKADLIEDAKFGGKKGQKEISKKQESLKLKAKKITEEIQKLKNNTSISEESKTDNLQQLSEEKQKIINEAKENDIFEGDIFEAGKEDKSPDVKENDPLSSI